MLNFSTIPARDRIIVALDCAADEAIALASELQGHAKWVKIGMTTYYEAGPDIVHAMKERGFNVFLDLKFFDIPHQVEGAMRTAVMSGADMLTMHALGGAEMMQAAINGAKLAACGTSSSNSDSVHMPITLGVSVLTSMNDEVLHQVGVSCSMTEQVQNLAKLAMQSGLSGVVCSAQEAHMLRQLLGEEAYIVTPGIRPKGANTDDQARICTPAQAFENGSSHIVVGRPITRASAPALAFEDIAKSLD